MVVKMEPRTAAASTNGAAAPSGALGAMASKSAPLATEPRGGGGAARDGLEVGLLGDEAEERGHRGHTGRRKYRDDEQRTAFVAEPREPADVAGAGGVVDDADDHEQRPFEQRVRAQQRQAREHQVTPPRPDP